MIQVHPHMAGGYLIPQSCGSTGEDGRMRTKEMEACACGGQKDLLQCSCKHGISESQPSSIKVRRLETEDQ